MDEGAERTDLAEELLSDAYEYVLSGWCQGAAALDECGRPIEPGSAFARRWSALGALERAWRRAHVEPSAARQAFERAKLALTAAVNDVPESWNDAPGRRQSEVLSALAEALQLVASAPARSEPDPLAELLEDVDRVGHRLAVLGVLFEGADGESAEASVRAKTPFAP